MVKSVTDRYHRDVIIKKLNKYQARSYTILHDNILPHTSELVKFISVGEGYCLATPTTLSRSSPCPFFFFQNLKSSYLVVVILDSATSQCIYLPQRTAMHFRLKLWNQYCIWAVREEIEGGYWPKIDLRYVRSCTKIKSFVLNILKLRYFWEQFLDLVQVSKVFIKVVLISKIAS